MLIVGILVVPQLIVNLIPLLKISIYYYIEQEIKGTIFFMNRLIKYGHFEINLLGVVDE